MSTHQFKAEPYKGGWVVYDTVTMEPIQTWADQDDAHQHAEELNYDCLVVERDKLKAFVSRVAAFTQDGEGGFTLEADDSIDTLRDLIDDARALTPKEEAAA